MLVYKIKTVTSKDTDLKSKKRLWLRVDIDCSTYLAYG